MRLNEIQFYHLAAQGRDRPRKCGILLKKTGKKTTGTAAEFPGIRWQKRYAVLHYNMLFYYENEFALKPQGLIMLEGTDCHRIFSYDKKLFCFVIGTPMQENRRFMFATESEYDCNDWIKHFSEASGAAMLEKQKNLAANIDTLEAQLAREKASKGKLQRECSDQWAQIARLKLQVSNLKCQNQRNSISSNGSRDSTGTNGSNNSNPPLPNFPDSDYSDKDCKQIIKLQAFIRGWSARCRWKTLKEMFIISPYAEILSQRNSLVWQFLTSEEDYVQQLSTLVSVFLKPLRLAAESGANFINRTEVEQLFLNSEVLLLMHEMFLKGLKGRLEYWPLVQLDDFFQAMLSMMSLYHDYVRNHPQALQILATCKQRPKFRKLLNWYEKKPDCHGQTLEQLLHHPVQLISTYIRSVHDILSVTPPEHPEKKTLEKVLEKLEDVHLSLNEHLCDGESRRHTLDIERTIDGGCDVLLDPEQKFIRHGILRQLGIKAESDGQRREKTRHCFLFSKHFIVTSRTNDGSLRLAKECGIVPLMKAVLIEDGEDEGMSVFGRAVAFTLQVNSRDQSFSVTLLSARAADKAVWTSDITQCIYNLSLECVGSDTGSDFSQGDSLERDLVLQRPLSIPEEPTEDDSVVTPTSLSTPSRFIFDAQKIKPISEDPRLKEDADDIKYSKNVGVCNLPQIQLASVDRLLERLVDPRIPGTDYMDTFLLTYRLFTDGPYVLKYIMDCYYTMENDRVDSPSATQSPNYTSNRRTSVATTSECRSSTSSSPSLRRHRGSSIISQSSMSSTEDLNRVGKTPPMSPTSTSFWIAGPKVKTNGVTSSNDDESVFEIEMDSSQRLSKPYFLHPSPYSKDDADDVLHRRRKTSPAIFAGVYKSESVENLLSSSLIGSGLYGIEEGINSPSPIPKVALHGKVVDDDGTTVTVSSSPIKHIRSVSNPDNTGNGTCAIERGRSFASRLLVRDNESKRLSLPEIPKSIQFDRESIKLGTSPLLQTKQFIEGDGDADSLMTTSGSDGDLVTQANEQNEQIENNNVGKHKTLTSTSSNPLTSQPNKGRRPSEEKIKKKSSFLPNALKSKGKRTMSRSVGDKLKQSVENLFFGDEKDASPEKPKSRDVRTLAEELQNAGDHSRRGSNVEPFEFIEKPKLPDTKASKKDKKSKGDTLTRKSQPRKISRVSIRAVLPNRGPLKIMNVMKHWLSKHFQDFERCAELRNLLKSSFSELKEAEGTLPVVKEIVSNMEKSLDNQQQIGTVTQMDEILARKFTAEEIREVHIEQWTPQSIADNLTLLEHYLYAKIPSHEFLSCSWTHKDKETRAPNILKVIRRFNHVSNMIAHEVIHLPSPDERAKRMEFWIATAALCRDLNNFNSVLQIIGALTNSAVYRLKKSWAFVPKHLKVVLQDLQSLVTTDKSFRQLRQALHKCNPPCVPYIGFYLSDLLFVDEGASNYKEELVNFAKMNRISRLVKEIKQYQQLRYTLDFSEDISQYLVASHVKTNEDDLYEESLLAEPREPATPKQDSPSLILSSSTRNNSGTPTTLASPIKEKEVAASFEERLIM